MRSGSSSFSVVDSVASALRRISGGISTTFSNVNCTNSSDLVSVGGRRGGLAIPVIFAWWQGHTDCREPHSQWTWRSERRSLPPRGSVSRSSPDSCCSTNYEEGSVHGPTQHTITHTLTHNHTHSADPETRRRLNSEGPLCGSLQGLKHSHEEGKR